ncbi:MAG: glutamate racemase [Chitinispirillaceae bacterium]|nr:glutamate racemase [Chitinispirillaceae bacterium]
MSDPRPIGVLDSGTGGLTVVREIVRLMPGERLIYAGDTARFPYGNRPEETIRSFALQGAETLFGRDIKLLVVACNTISAVALEAIERYARDVPVIGAVLPGARAAVLRTADRKIGVIGTHATIRSGAYKKAIERIDSAAKVYETATPFLIPLVEEMMFDHDITRLTVQFYLYEMIDLGVDCLILGCTHYPPLLEVVQGTVGTRMQIIDSALWTAKEVQDILTALDLCSEPEGGGLGQSAFFFTETPLHTAGQLPLFFGEALPHQKSISFAGGAKQ